MPTKEQLLELVRAGRSYEDIGRVFGIPPGQAYMIVTGFPADGSTTVGPEFLRSKEGLLPGSTQHLANPPTTTPQRDETVLEWLKSRAATDPQMQQAAAARTAEPPPVQGEEETDDIVSVIGWDHNQVKYLLEELEAIPGVSGGGRPAQQRQRASIVDMIRVRLSEHETAEEQYFWPTVRERLRGGEELADEALGQEQEGKDHLQAMMGKDGTEEEFDEQVEKLSLLLRKHVAFEDRVLLEFWGTVPDDVRNDLGRRFVSAKSRAPTRPHPHAPKSPAANKLAAAVAAPLDKARDAAGDRPAEQKGQVSPDPGAGPSASGAES